MILNYTIFGERNSGTNYLKMVLDRVLDVPFTAVYGFKHWYIKNHLPRCRPNTTADNECLRPLENHHHTLFVFIVRNPLDWTAAMFRRPYHMPDRDAKNFRKFLTQPYKAYERNLPENHKGDSFTPWSIDTLSNTYFIEEASNIIDLRNTKNNHFYRLQEKVRYYQLIRLEHIREDVMQLHENYGKKVISNWEDIFHDYVEPNVYDVEDSCRDLIMGGIKNIIDETYYSGESPILKCSNKDY